MIESYPKIYNLGHAELRELFSAPVLVEEKIDGSQFSFGVDREGFLRCRSKGCQIDFDNVPKMFNKGVATAKALHSVGLLPPGLTFRGEFLSGPKHNVLCYDRAPAKNFILFDVNTGIEAYATRAEKEHWGRTLGLEVVPLMFEGMIKSADDLRELLETTSVLGGQKVEGVVIKPAEYNLFGRDKKCVLGKFVSERFREVHAAHYKTPKPKEDIIEKLGKAFVTEARWDKAIQHRKEDGTLENSPRDIGPLLKEISDDVLAEEEEAIKTMLMGWAWPQLKKKLTIGFPEWYKQKLLESQFDEVTNERQ